MKINNLILVGPPQDVHLGQPDEDMNQLEVLFAMLDNEVERLGIESYTLECTSLEQIFLEMEQNVPGSKAQKMLQGEIHDTTKLDETGDSQSETSERTISSDDQSCQLIQRELLTGFHLLTSQLSGLFYKRFLHSLRDWKYGFSIIILPTLLLALSMVLGLLKPDDGLPPLLMTPSIYEPSSYFFFL